MSLIDSDHTAAPDSGAAAAPAPGATPAIMVDTLIKNSGEVHAVRGVNFEVATGEVFGFLGPNGAGKTTTINMLCTLARPTSGVARVAGHAVGTEADAGGGNIGPGSPG